MPGLSVTRLTLGNTTKYFTKNRTRGGRRLAKKLPMKKKKMIKMKIFTRAAALGGFLCPALCKNHSCRGPVYLLRGAPCVALPNGERRAKRAGKKKKIPRNFKLQKSHNNYIDTFNHKRKHPSWLITTLDRRLLPWSET